MMLITSVIFFIFSTGVAALKVSVDGFPDVVMNGDPVWLNCTFEKEGETLYSVKWYKDYLEFYRYVITDDPVEQCYAVPGIYVNLTKSNLGSVYLYQTDDNSIGEYACEVQADAPSFTTVTRYRVMKVAGEITRRNLTIDVPSVVKKGVPVLLRCAYDLEENDLYYIHWYKDGINFYSHFPKSRSGDGKRLFNQPGIYVDMARSNFGNVYLYKTDENSVGDYKCKASLDSPICSIFYSQTREMWFSGIDDPNLLVPKIVAPDFIFSEDPNLVSPFPTLPQNVTKLGKPMWMNCTSRRSGLKLYSIAWYKDNTEIYRYTRKDPSGGRIFNVPGVNITRTDIGNILIGNITADTQGLFRCEVTADAPSFATNYAEKKIKLMSAFLVNITGVDLTYAVGDKVHVKCETGPTVQNVPMKLYINGEEAKGDQLKSIVISDEKENLKKNILELSFIAGHQHFDKGAMEFHCKAYLFENYFDDSLIIAFKSYVKHPDIFGSIVPLGSDIEFPCDVTSPSQDDEPVLIVWYKDDKIRPLFVFDSRKKGVARFVPNEAVIGRSTVDITRNPAVLKIENSIVDDVGAYRCRVYFKNQRAKESLIYIEMIVPYKKL